MDNTGIFVIRSSRISSGPGRLRYGGDDDDDYRAAEDDEIDRCGGERLDEQERGGQLGDDGSGSLEGELSSGMAVVRDIDAFVALETDLRVELSQNVDIPALPIDGVSTGTAVAMMDDNGKGGGREMKRAGGDITTHDDVCVVLSGYLSSLLGMPEVVGSDAMSRFLERDDTKEGRYSAPTPAKEEDDEEESSLSSSPIPDFDGRNFADYIFRGVDSDETSTMISIPRRESFRHSPPENVLPPGWWIVWQYRVETSGPPLEFGVYLRSNDGDDGDGDHDADDDEDVASSPAWECVLQESIGQTSEVVRGSYRCEPDHHHHDEDSSSTDGTNVRCVVLRFSNTASILRGARLHHLAVRCVPHDAFGAAFEAAGEQARADERVRRSPLLRHILDDSSLERPVRLVVEPVSSSMPVKARGLAIDRAEEGRCHDDPSSRTKIGSGTAHPPWVAPQSPSSCAAEPAERDDDTWAEDGGEGGDDERGGKVDSSSSSAPPPGRSSIDDALLGGSGGVDEEVLAAMRMEIESLRSTVDFLNAERSQWSISEKQMREGLSRSSKLLDEERERNARFEAELEERTRETLELRSEVEYLRGRVIPTEVEIERAEKDLHDAKSETRRAHDMIDMLRAQVSELKRENEKLSAELREHRESASDALLNATAEADEARMMQRILEGKVREMERLLVCRSGASVAVDVAAAATAATASSGIVAPGLDGGNGNGNGNGNGGKWGGNGVVVTEATNGTNAGGGSSPRSTGKRAVEGESSRSNDGVGSRRRGDPRGSSSSTAVDRRSSFVHPDPRINDQLVGLRERHCKLLAITYRRSDHPGSGSGRRRNAELIGKIEDAIEAIISSAASSEA